MIKVSVIIPTHNNELTIEKTLDSVLNHNNTNGKPSKSKGLVKE